MSFLKYNAPLIALVTFAAAFLAPSFASAQVSSPASTCAVPGHPTQAEYYGLKGINLYVQFPFQYDEALVCHGKENECLQRAVALGGPGFDKPKQAAWLNHLKAVYDMYPKALAPDVIVPLYRDALKKAFAPILPRGDNCQVPDPFILDQPKISSATADPSALTLTVLISITETTKPHIATITVFEYRPDHNSYEFPRTTPIPLDLPDTEISEFLVKTVANRIRTPNLEEWIRR